MIFKKDPVKTKILLSILVFTFLSCTDEKSYDDFDFSYGNTFETDFSIKFTQSDTVYIRENWSYNDINQHSISPKSKTNYYSIISKGKKKEFKKILNSIDFSQFDTLYYEDYSDGDEYKFYINKEGVEKTIYIHSLKPPKELDSLANWIYSTKKKFILINTNKTETFKSKILMPEPPPQKLVFKN